MKARFEGKLRLDFLDEAVDGKWFMTVKPFIYIAESGMRYYITGGTRTDFASVPRIFRSLIARVGKYGKAAVLHDFLCETKFTSRKKADKLLLEAMKVLGVGWLKRRIMYLSVRTYSIATFKK